MKCRNPHCQNKSFCAIVEPDNNRVIGLKCLGCGARYSIEDIEIKEGLNREGRWCSYKWTLRVI